MPTVDFLYLLKPALIFILQVKKWNFNFHYSCTAALNFVFYFGFKNFAFILVLLLIKDGCNQGETWIFFEFGICVNKETTNILFGMIIDNFIVLQMSIILAHAWMPFIVKNQNQLLLKIETREEILKHIFHLLLHPRSLKYIAKWELPCTLLDDFCDFAWFLQRQALNIKSI